MGWCPECECEYVEGIEVCVDCGCALVESQESNESGESMEFMDSIDSMSSLREGRYEAEHYDFEETKDQEATASPAEQLRTRTAVYRNSDEIAEEHRSSAYTLLIVGGIGILVIILFFFDVFPIRMATFSKYMISGVMGVMFILFIIMGIVSMKNSRILAGKATRENNLTREIKGWCMENIQPSKLDSMLFTEAEEVQLSEEIKYFRRFDKIKDILGNQFVNLDEGYLDRLIDEIYPELFES